MLKARVAQGEDTWCNNLPRMSNPLPPLYIYHAGRKSRIREFLQFHGTKTQNNSLDTFNAASLILSIRGGRPCVLEGWRHELLSISTN